MNSYFWSQGGLSEWWAPRILWFIDGTRKKTPKKTRPTSAITWFHFWNGCGQMERMYPSESCFQFLCPVRIVTWAFTKTHRDESFKNKPSSDCQENIYWRRWLSSPSHPQNDLRLPRASPHSPHTPQNSCWKWACVTGPLGGSQQGLEAVKSRPPQPWTAPPLSQSQRGKDLNLGWPHQAKSLMGSSTGHSSGSPHP